ncbi:hypothetical protein MP638_003486 [Amoeboaphelidium occidentale]|nr:hypothetical protein MP638_003486 [Amoeboaphelidium occidentale]
MFTQKGLFKSIVCPEFPGCKRPYCLFSHRIVQGKPHDNANTTQLSSIRDPVALVASNSTKTTTEDKVNANQKLQQYSAEITQSNSKVSVFMRKKVIEQFTAQYQRLMGNEQEAKQKAFEVEADVHEQNNPKTYQNAAAMKLLSLKRAKPEDHEKPKKRIKTDGFSSEFIKKFVHDINTLKLNDYPYALQSIELFERTVTQECDRCGERFLVRSKDELLQLDDLECSFHPYKARRIENERFFECCGESPSNSKGCTKGHHVYAHSSFTELAKYEKFFTISQSSIGNRERYQLIAMDCEMGYTTHGSELLRLSAVNERLETILDVFVHPVGEIIDYNTRWSGIDEESFNKAEKISITEARRRLSDLMDSDTVFVGHSLESDLKALRLIHLNVLDTSLLYPHRRGPPYKMSLKNLAKENLQIFIQDSSDGHDSVEDAKAAMSLALLYLKNKKKEENAIVL